VTVGAMRDAYFEYVVQCDVACFNVMKSDDVDRDEDDIDDE
jgi:hypothetical protein